MLEYRLACEAQPRECRVLVGDAMRLARKAERVARIGESAVPEVRYDVARALAETGAVERALGLLGDPVMQGNVQGARLEAELLIETGDLQRAGLAGTRLIEASPESHVGYLLLSRVHLARGDRDAAAEALRMGLQRLPQHVQLLSSLGDLLLRAGKFGEANKIAQEMLQTSLDPGQRAKAHALASKIHRAEGNLVNALYELRRAKDTFPHVEDYRLDLAALRVSMGDRQGGVLELERAIEELGSSERLREALARLKHDDAPRR